MDAVTEIESWIRIGATVGIGGSGLWLIWFLAKRLWATVWEGTKEQNVLLKKDNLELRNERDAAEKQASAWESNYHELYDEYLSYVPPDKKVPRKRRAEMNQSVTP